MEDAEVACAPQDAFGAAHDQADGVFTEDVVRELDAIELSEDERAHVVGV